MKEMMEELGGQLRWMSSERQVADGLTKESARALLAARLRHRRIKLTWDPEHVASKKKTKGEKAKAIAETTAAAPHVPPHLEENENPVDEQIPANVSVSEYPEIFSNEDQPRNEETPDGVFCVQNVEPLTYAFAMSHGGLLRDTTFKCRISNIFVMLLLASMPTLTEGQQCVAEAEEKENEEGQLWLWLAILAMMHVLAMATVFMIGRWTAPRLDQKKENVIDTKEAETQKDEPIVPSCIQDFENYSNRSNSAVQRLRDQPKSPGPHWTSWSMKWRPSEPWLARHTSSSSG